jgi:pyrroloquinoline quinone (PQQ) biosynthesis protein C
MNFYEQLQQATSAERAHLLENPLITRSLRGELTREEYVAFLLQAYHHVKHTVPLLMAVGARIPEEKEWLRNAVAEYIKEEIGHQEWILNDIATCGYDKGKARHSTPNMDTELMVAYAYDLIGRVNPLGFFGMVLVLEGTSVTAADHAANQIQDSLGLPRKAFTYLRSHGALDLDHVKFFESLMNRITDSMEQQQIIHCAKVFYHLYGNIFHSVKPEQVTAIRQE